MTCQQLVRESRRWLSIINVHSLNERKRRKIVADTVDATGSARRCKRRKGC